VRAYIIRRLLILIPTLLLLTLVVFVLTSLIPGDIVTSIQARIPEEQIDRAALEKRLGLDKPLIVQYGRWLGVLPQADGRYNGLFQGSLGESWWRSDSVVNLVSLKWPISIELGLLGLIIAQLIALPIGIYSALRQNKLGDYAARTFAILCISVPGFWLGTLIIVFPAIWWGYMPPLMLIRFADNPIGNLGMFILPSIVLGMALSGFTMRMTRTMMLEVLRQDYIRTAWSKGLRERVVVRRHALKNALIPVVTGIGLQVPVLIGGTVIIENIFNLPGMGRLLFDAISQRDEPLVCGVTIIFSASLVLINLMVDLTYGYLDPRIHYA
jgi:peptide/nickel transport system permease protein